MYPLDFFLNVSGKDKHMTERRRSPRYEVVLKLRYETEEAFGDTVIRSLSSGGLYLSTQTPFNVGSEFAVVVDLPQKEEWIKGTCEVVWVNEIDTENYPKGMGVRFIQMAPEYRSRLEAYLADMNVGKN
jgi:uncharacterized protein (TIGR02266 family)